MESIRSKVCVDPIEVVTKSVTLLINWRKKIDSDNLEKESNIYL